MRSQLKPITISYRRAVRRKANLEVTGEEKPKTRLRRRKANKRLCREKKGSLGPPRRRKASFTCLGRKKFSNYQKRLIHADSAVHLSSITALQCFKQMFKIDDELGIVSILIQDA